MIKPTDITEVYKNGKKISCPWKNIGRWHLSEVPDIICML